MKNEMFINCLKEIFDKHVPLNFFDSKFKDKFLDEISSLKMSRRELLTLAYFIGAEIEEANKMLEINNYSPLYIRRREDVIWKFMLKNRKDANFIIDEILFQNAKEF